MLSLAQATSNVRLAAKILAGLAVIGVVGYLVFIGVKYVISITSPPDPAEQGFGELPTIQFPAVPATSSQFEYRVNTIDGSLPALPGKLLVYETIQPQATFLALENVRSKMASLGYESTGTELERNLFQFTRESGEVIKYHVLNDDFEVFSNYVGDSGVGSFRDDAQNAVVSATTSFLSTLSIPMDEFREAGEEDYSYFALSGGGLIEVAGLSQANFLRYDLYQKALSTPYGNGEEELPVVYPRAGFSTMNFLYAPSVTNVRLVEAHFDYFPIDRESSSDYYIITASEAFEKLKEGEAHLAKYDPNDDVVDITDVRMGYYMGEIDQGYVMPVVIFEGNNFVAYVDAVNRSVEETSESSE